MGYYKAGIRPLRIGSAMRVGNAMRVGATTLVGAVGAGKPTLRQGSNGQFVMELQTKLGLPVDSLFGPQTAAAVKKFQASHGLSADGVVGPQTWTVLNQTEALPAVPVTLENKPVIQQGASGAAVIEAQHRLGVTVDGIFGPQTATAVKEFQHVHGLVQDGVVGPLTWNAIESNTPPVPPAPGATAITQSPPVLVLVTPTGEAVTHPDGTPQTAPPGTPPVVLETIVDTTPNGTIPQPRTSSETKGKGKGSDNGTLAMVGLGVAGALGLAAFISKRKGHT
jgi:peptidoglycan hydrolase-like protein with peptidoglycan-binding domain